MSDWVSHSYGLLGCCLLVLAVASFWLRRIVSSKPARFGMLAGIFVLSWIPLPRTSLVVFLRGVVGDIAIPTFLLCGLVVLGCLLAASNKDSPSSKKPSTFFFVPNDSLRGFFVLVVIVGLIFYPMTMGFSLMDPYAWGYTPHVMLLGCLGLILILEFMGQRFPATLILVSVAGYAAGLMESSNLWDYLMDPILFGIGLAMLSYYLVSRVRSSRRASAPP